MITSKAQRKALKKLWLRLEVPRLPYRKFRRAVQPTFCMDNCIMVPMHNMWIGVETDGYTHS